MNEKIKTQETEPSKVIIDLTDNFLNELYKKCNICQEQTNSEADENDPGTYMSE